VAFRARTLENLGRLMQSRLSDQHTVEVDNLAAINDRKHYVFDQSLVAAETNGRFWETLAELGISLVVSREYEHFIVALGAPQGSPYQSVLPLPHPSGMYFDAARRELIVSSTRTPNIIFWLRLLEGADRVSEIVPKDMTFPEAPLFLPYRSTLLPGTLYIHEIAQVAGELMATATGHNFVARLGAAGGWERVWWPRKLDALGSEAFQQNYLQLNGIAAGASIEDSFFTAFSDSLEGAKPWKDGYGPQGKGVVFSGQTREVVCRGLTCPHSIRREGNRLWLCNSGFGELAQIFDFAGPNTSRATAVARLPGFTRGLGFFGDLAFVGLSRVIESYEPYAPGIDPGESRCGIAIVDRRTGDVVGSLFWPNGYQVFDVVILPNLPRVLMPMPSMAPNTTNPYLRYLG
jgi:uncharacterized protein (TIGR03032 family)